MTGEVLAVLARRGTPPGQGGKEYWPGMIVDVPSTMQLVFQQSKSYVFCAAVQFLDIVPDIPVVPQKGWLLTLLCTTVAHGPDSAEQLRSPTWSSTSLFSLSEQWRCLRFSHRQCSMTRCFRGAFCAIFRTPPRGVESRGARIFRALDDEEFFVIEGSLVWRGRHEF